MRHNWHKAISKVDDVAVENQDTGEVSAGATRRGAATDLTENAIFVEGLGTKKPIVGKMRTMLARDLQIGKALSEMSLLMCT